MRFNKTVGYALVMVMGVSIGLAVGFVIGRAPSPQPSVPISYEIKKASPETMGNEIVNDEVLALLTDMYNGQAPHMQMKTDNIIYPYQEMDEEKWNRLSALFSEYEWRANRALSSFDASDFYLFIEIYTPDMTQVLTLYGGYDLVCYRDKRDETVAYFTYMFPEEDVYADLAVRLSAFRLP